jgi:Rrf2 family protein
MRLSARVEHAVYCCLVLASLPGDETRTTSQLASLFGFPKAYLAKSMQTLSNSGILNARPGRAGGYRLAQPASTVTLRDIVVAVESSGRSYKPDKIDATHDARMSGLARAIQAADTVWLAELGKTTLTELIDQG